MKLRKPQSSWGTQSSNGFDARTAPVILVGVDGAQASLRAAAYAVGLAARQHARLLFVQVWPEPVVPALFGQLIPVDWDVIDSHRATLMEQIGELVGDLDIPWELRQVVGYPRNEFPRVSAEVGADAIILGAPSSAWSMTSTALARRLMIIMMKPTTRLLKEAE